ncbi:MAG: RNA-binding S4 domain-containing protein [Alphaproteobacteria bacterium]|nr:RNA-binding S4 domain-containing protein [Alphaproteobacteria bacterium]
MTKPDPAIRLDKWLWHARFFKSRSLAGKICGSGRIRVDGTSVEKAHYGVRIGQVVTFPQAHRIRVVKVLGLGTRRGPAPEARLLYEDLSVEVPQVPRVPGIRPVPVARWDKRDRNKDVW